MLQDRIPPEPDAPEWIEANAAFLAAGEQVAKALAAVFSTPPATIAGVADVLDYVGRDEWELAISLESPDAVLREPLDLPGTVIENAFEHAVEEVREFLPMIAARLPRRPTGGPDPIFAAIERHRAAFRAWLAAGEQVWPETIPPEVETVIEELHNALEAVLSTPPATIAGVADVLDYVGRDEWELLLSVGLADVALFDSNDFDGTVLENAFDVEKLGKAAEKFLPMVAATLRSLAAAPS